MSCHSFSPHSDGASSCATACLLTPALILICGRLSLTHLYASASRQPRSFIRYAITTVGDLQRQQQEAYPMSHATLAGSAATEGSIYRLPIPQESNLQSAFNQEMPSHCMAKIRSTARQAKWHSLVCFTDSWQAIRQVAECHTCHPACAPRCATHAVDQHSLVFGVYTICMQANSNAMKTHNCLWTEHAIKPCSCSRGMPRQHAESA